MRAVGEDTLKESGQWERSTEPVLTAAACRQRTRLRDLRVQAGKEATSGISTGTTLSIGGMGEQGSAHLDPQLSARVTVVELFPSPLGIGLPARP